MAWGHGKFRERLISKAEELGKQVEVVGVEVVGEAFTSKTCSRCGWVDQRLGGRKMFRCRACGLTVDRDVNGARGSSRLCWIKLSSCKASVCISESGFTLLQVSVSSFFVSSC